MAKYDPFAEKAGMQKIIEQPPQQDALKIAMILKNLGFNIEFLGSKTYDLKKLQSLDQVDLIVIREAFSKYNHPRFMKYFFAHQPFGKRQEFISIKMTPYHETLRSYPSRFLIRSVMFVGKS